jgi:hypothetical protein
MRHIIPFAFIFLIWCCSSCGDSSSEQSVDLQPKDVPASFFPVDHFIKGEISQIRSLGKSPLSKITGKPQDSAWINIEKLDSVFSPFLTPPIDSAGLSRHYKETKFVDETVHALTLTYDPIGELPADLPWQNWIVYINPETGSVQKIYLVKTAENNKTLQLTWVAGKYCKLVTLSLDTESQKNKVEQETYIRWDY